MSSLFSSFFQLAGAKSFSEFLKEDEKKLRKTKRKSLRKTVAQRRKAKKTSRRTARRTSRRTARRTMRKRSNVVRVRNLTNRKVKGKAGKHECLTCKKGVKAYYTGKEPSPKGFGYCARCTPLNVTMKGKNGKLWENRKFSKGKRWVQI